MAQVGIIHCEQCSHVFRGSIGGMYSGDEFACIDCDHIAYMRWNIEEGSPPVLSCSKCGAAMAINMNRKCPVCGSRDTKMGVVDIHID